MFYNQSIFFMIESPTHVQIRTNEILLLRDIQHPASYQYHHAIGKVEFIFIRLLLFVFLFAWKVRNWSVCQYCMFLNSPKKD